MPLVVHEIDPNPDTIIILKNPSKYFAVWDESIKAPEPPGPVPDQIGAQPGVSADGKSASPASSRKINLKASKRKARRRFSWNDDGKPPVTEEPAAASHHSSFGGEPSSQNAHPPESGPNEMYINDGGEKSESGSQFEEPTEEEEIHYLVSSRHLTLASPWFRRNMAGDWCEANRDPADGMFHMWTEDWDEEAFLILLSIFHLRTRRVPQTVSLEMLAKIAVLVDYYEPEEAIELFTNMWLDDLRGKAPVPSTYCRDLMLWMWISQVFNLADVFTQTTLVALKESTESMQTLDLPLHPGIARRISQKRCEEIDSIISKLHDLVEVFRSATYKCPQDTSYSFQCGSFLFGALTKELARWEFLPPRPGSPFAGMSLQVVAEMASSARNPQWYHSNNGSYGYYDYTDCVHEPHECNLNTKLKTLIQGIMSNVKGLTLSELREGQPKGD